MNSRTSEGGRDRSIPRIIAGLGNPGVRYRKTRHNLGFRVLDRRAKLTQSDWKKQRRFPAWTARSGGLILVKPATFVNLSGQAVRAVLDYYKLSPIDLVVVVDDVNLPAGRIRIRNGGGGGGHHGLESIIRHLNTRSFARIRIGVGGGELEDLTSHVLSRPGRGEELLYRRAVEDAGEALELIAKEGMEAAMNKYNRKTEKTDEEGTD